MRAIVIDTNILLVADGQARQMSPACRIECLDRLEMTKCAERVVLDDRRLILEEYGHKLNPSKRPPSPGGLFLKWLLVNQSNPKHTACVPLTPLNPEQTRFKEFPPDPELEAAFDPSDRKFVAAAYSHPDKPPILESADSKWLGWEGKLKAHNLTLEVLCRCELEEIRRRKTGASS